MRNRALWIGTLATLALLIAGSLLWRATRTTDPDPSAQPAAPVGSGGLARTPAPALGAPIDSPQPPVASFDCARPTGDAARVDGVGIPLDLLCKRLTKLGALTKAGADHAQARIALDHLIDATLVRRALEQAHATVDDAEVATAVKNVRPADTVSSSDSSLLHEQLREQLELAKLISLRAKVEVSNQDVDAEIASGAPGIDRGQGIRVEPWIARLPPNASAAASDAASAQAQEFVTALKSKPPEQAAKDHGLARMPAFVLGENGVERTLEEVALAARKGDWTRPVRTRVGWTVLHVLGNVEGEKLDNEGMRQRVRQALLTRKSQAARQRVLEELRRSATIEIVVE